MPAATEASRHAHAGGRHFRGPKDYSFWECTVFTTPGVRGMKARPVQLARITGLELVVPELWLKLPERDVARSIEVNARQIARALAAQIKNAKPDAPPEEPSDE